jgi:L-fucose isomerase-like protein
MSPNFGFITVRPTTLVDEAALETITGDYARSLEALGGRRWRDDPPPDEAAQLFLLVATGGTEQAILDLWTKRRKTQAGEALFLIAHPGNNSLPAALEVLARLHQDGAQGRIFYLEGPSDASGLTEIANTVHDISVRRTLDQARIGLVGTPSDWLVASSPEPSTVKKTWGPTVVPIAMDDVVGALQSVPKEELEAQAAALVAGAVEVREPTPSDITDVVRLYLALKGMVAEHRLDALTVRCFDFVQHHKTTGCFALAQLTDEGVIAGCEGDLVSTIGLLWAQKLLGANPWMANPAQLDPSENRLTLAHCTIPRSLVESYRLRSHFESGLGVGIQGMLAGGPATLLRIGGPKMDRLWLAEGEVLQSCSAENLCRTQVEIKLTRGGHVDDLLRAPLGNHLVLVFGHHLDRLRSWCEVAAHAVVISGTT